MRLHDLKPAKGSTHRRKRVGRGEGSGLGKTSGRGQKGTKARNKVPIWFEGGQMPIQRRLPKLGGFTPINRVEFAPVNVGALSERFDAGATVSPEDLVATGLVRKRMKVKVLAQGDIGKALTVRAHRFSKQAKEKIEAAGGTTEVL
ncbi:MAG: 50S ribosomal protein L15 [Actinomycetota bacterium]